MDVLDKQKALKLIPPVHEILECPQVIMLIEQFGRDYVIKNIQLVMDAYRKEIDTNESVDPRLHNPTRDYVSKYLIKMLDKLIAKQHSNELKKVINATGIVLHTNLGRAPFPKQAADSIQRICEGYSNLEFDMETGTRGLRSSRIEEQIMHLTGAESAMIVNNNAAAVFLCLNTLAGNKEVIVSRGQQVEIGGSFRIPDIISRSEAKMVEVGTTNKTHLSDYSDSITDETAILLKVHTSNYKVTGFCHQVSLQELVALGEENHVPVVEDLGSGSLYDLSLIGLPYEPTVQESIQKGVDLVTFSGDKLLGGPQAGIIAGKKKWMDRIKKNPLARIVRCDKTTIMAMTSVLDLYMNSKNVVEKIPVLKMMALKESELYDKALELNELINSIFEGRIITEIVDDLDEIGGGSLPGVILKGKAVALVPRDLSVNVFQEKLRQAEIPVICRIHKDRVLINVRTLTTKEYPLVIEAIKGVLL